MDNHSGFLMVYMREILKSSILHILALTLKNLQIFRVYIILNNISMNILNRMN